MQADALRDKVEFATDLANPITMALTLIVLRHVFRGLESVVDGLIGSAIACAGFSLVLYSIRTAFKSLRAEPSLLDYAFVSLRRVLDEIIAPLIVAYTSGYLLAYVFAGIRSPLMFTFGFIYFLTSRYLIRLLALEYVSVVRERIYNPRYVLLLGLISAPLSALIAACLVLVYVLIIKA